MILILWSLSALSCLCFLVWWLFCKTNWYLVLAEIFWMPTLPNDCNPKTLVYFAIGLQAWIDTNDNFHFQGTGEKLPLVLLWIEVALLHKYLDQNIKINNLLINIENWSTFIKLVDNSALKKAIFSGMQRNFAFPCDWGTFLWLFSLFVCL